MINTKPNVKAYWKKLNKENIIFIYNGVFTQSMIPPILKMTEQKLESLNENKSRKKLVIISLIEIFQNIQKHSQNINNNVSGILLFGIKDNKYVICGGNLIDKKKVDNFKKYLQKLNKMNRTELSGYYKVKLDEDIGSVLGGAGIGLIDIARNSSQSFKFKFKNNNSETSFFFINIEI